MLRRTIILLFLMISFSVPITVHAYGRNYGYHGYSHHNKHHYGYSYGHYPYYTGHHYGYSYGYHPYYTGHHYGYSYGYKRPSYHDRNYESKEEYYHRYLDDEGYTYFLSRRYGKIYCDHPKHQEYHDSDVGGSVEYYCGDKYSHHKTDDY